MARASPGRCRVWTLEQRGVLRPHSAHSPIPIPSCPNPGPGPAGHCVHTTPVVSTPRCYGLSVKCIFQTAFNGRQYFLAGLTLHVRQLRAAFSPHVGAAVHAACRAGALPAPAFLPEPVPASRARQGRYTLKRGSAWERHAMATAHSPAGEGGRTCFLGCLLSLGIWDKQVSLLSSSAFGKGKV